METTNIKIERKKAIFNRARDMQVFIDDSQKKILKNGEQTSLEITPGTHTLNVKLGKLGSPIQNIDIKSGETLSFEVSNTPLFVKLDILLAILFIVTLVAILADSIVKNYSSYVYLFFGIYISLKHLVFKNKYLTLNSKSN